MSDVEAGSAEMKSQDVRGILPAGTRLRGYEIVSILGQGAFGITYRARDATLHRDVAIKEYLPTSLALREGDTTVVPRSTEAAEEFVWGRERFLEEARTLARLDRAPAVVRVHDFLEDNGTAYMVTALVEGETLEARIRRLGKLDNDAIAKLVRPLLDGLEQVHASGYLHRDIKPANILLDAQGNPTLIDFGAARAALAGGSVAMTAIFTPGYAAPEQFTSAKQGPWTDIYGVAATLYHAVVGKIPPSAFDRMLDDTYAPLLRLQPKDFASDLLAGIDAGLAVRAADRPQSVAGWRAIIWPATAFGGDAATVVLGRRPDPATTAAEPAPVRRRAGPWAGAVAAAVILAGGSYYLATSSTLRPGPAPVIAAAATDANKAKESQAAAAAAADEQRKAEAEGALRRQVAEETRRQIEAEQVEQKRLDDEARQKAEVDAAAKRQADEETKRKADAATDAARKLEAADKKAAEANETILHLTPLDRQHIQVALSALGFDTGGTDGAFGPRSRDMIAAWQKTRSDAATGFLTGAQNQALLKDAAPAVSSFDADQRKADETRARTTVPSPTASPQTIVPSPAAAPPPPSIRANALRTEPPAGLLREGKHVLVDDGTCPPGQIKEVTGGNDKKGRPRTKQCVSSAGR